MKVSCSKIFHSQFQSITIKYNQNYENQIIKIRDLKLSIKNVFSKGRIVFLGCMCLFLASLLMNLIKIL